MPNDPSNAATSDPNAPDQASSPPQGGEPNPNQTPNEPSQTSGNAPPSEPKGLESVGFTFSNDASVPSYLRGRDIKDTVKIVEDLYGALQTNTHAPAAPTHAAPTAPTPAAPPTSGVDPNLIYSNPEEYHRRLREDIRHEMRQELTSAADTVTTPLMSMAKSQAGSHRPDIWERYGPEVETMMASVAPTLKTNPETWKRAVDLVASNHVEELAQARVDAIIAARSDAGSISGGAGGGFSSGGGSVRSPIEKLFDEDHPAIHGFKSDRVDAATVAAHARARGYSEDDYANLLRDRATRRAGV